MSPDHTLTCAAPLSERLLRALAPFALVPRHAPGPTPPAPSTHQLRALLDLPPGRLALIRGPSGCGKSTLLRAASGAIARRGGAVLDPERLLSRADPTLAIIDLFTQPLETTLRLLAGAGLGEAALWARTAPELSEGQRARLGLALAMARAGAEPHPWLILDECLAPLDAVTGAGVATTMRRWHRSHPAARILAATSREDLTEALAPDLILHPCAEAIR